MRSYYLDLAEPPPASRLPTGARLRHVTGADTAERIDVHRGAWIASAFDERYYARVQASSGYDPELDIVLELADGTFVSYCICWADPVTKVGYFEPVGTRSEWRGRGFGIEVLREGLRRLRASGMRMARVATAGFNAPAQNLYEATGFTRHDINRTWLTVVPD